MRIATEHLRAPPSADSHQKVTPREYHPNDSSSNASFPPSSDGLCASSPDILIIENPPSPPPMHTLDFVKASQLPPPPRRNPSIPSKPKYVPTPRRRRFPRKSYDSYMRAPLFDQRSPSDVRSTMLHSPPSPINFDQPLSNVQSSEKCAANVPETCKNQLSIPLDNSLSVQLSRCQDTVQQPPKTATSYEAKKSFVKSMMLGLELVEEGDIALFKEKLQRQKLASLRRLFSEAIGEEAARARLASGVSQDPLPAHPRRELTNLSESHQWPAGSNLSHTLKGQKKGTIPNHNAAPHKNIPNRTQKRALNKIYPQSEARPPLYENSGYLNLNTQGADATHILESAKLPELPNLSSPYPPTQNPPSKLIQPQSRQNPSARKRADGTPFLEERERNTALPLHLSANPSLRGGAHRTGQNAQHNYNNCYQPDSSSMHELSTSQKEAISRTETASLSTKRGTSDGEEEKFKPRKRRKTTAAENPGDRNFDSYGVLLTGKRKYRVEGDVNYIGYCHVAMQRQPSLFIDLKFEPTHGKELEACLHGIKATIWTRAENGEKTKKLKSRKFAKTKKAAKLAAAGGLFCKILEVYPNLSYQGSAKAKETKGEENTNPNANEEVLELNTFQILDNLFMKSLIQKKPRWSSELKDQWEASCIVFVSKKKKGKAISVPFLGEAKHRAKKHAMRWAANDVINKLIEDGVKGVEEEKVLLLGKPKSVPNNECEDDKETNTTSCVDGGDEEKSEEEVNATETGSAFSAWLNYPDAEFRVPEGYVVTVAKRGSECKEFIDEHEEEKIGVYLESPDVYRSITDGHYHFEETNARGRISVEHDECKVIALAVERRALLLIESQFAQNENWPPACLVDLFRNPHAELCGYKLNGGGHALGFTSEYRHCINDIQAVANGLKNGRELRKVIHMPLADIVRNWTGKLLGKNRVVLDSQGIAGSSVDESRAKTAIYTAAAVLAAYHFMCLERDAKMRNSVGSCAIPGFNDLMNVLGGRTQLLPIT